MFPRKSRILLKIVENGSRRCLSSQKREFKEVSIKVPWGQVSGKWWEPYDSRPILTLHGWQDNCGSFDRLIPLLNPNVGVLAIDFPGHGYSSKLPPGIYYQFKTYILTIGSIAKSFNWPKISFMGHSMGSVIGYVCTMIYPKEVDFLICLDGAKPAIDGDKVELLAERLQHFPKYATQAASRNEPPSYTMEDIVAKTCRAHGNSVLPQYAKYIIERNIAPSKLHEGKFHFTRDPRLKCNDTVPFSQDELVHYAQRITPPIFMAKPTESSYGESKENFYQVLDVLKRTSIDCDFHYTRGTHHMHLNNPEDVSDLIVNFIRRHNVEDRSIGGITDDVIVHREKRTNTL